jgi:hypothetical protein
MEAAPVARQDSDAFCRIQSASAAQSHDQVSARLTGNSRTALNRFD